MSANPPTSSERKLVVVGAGRVGVGIVASVPSDWAVTLVDRDEGRLGAALPDRVLQRVVGDASSRLVLERCGLHASATLVLTTHDDAVNLEAARLARQEHGVQDIVAVLDGDTTALEGVDVVTRTGAVLTQLRGRIGGVGGGVLHAGGSGGELLQVPILAGSPVIGRRVRELHRGDWLIAMLYRQGTLIVPRGDTVILEGDRVLLAGEPADLGTVAMFFRGGQPTFPAAWGSKVAYGDSTVEAAAGWLVARTTATEVVAVQSDLLDGAEDAVERATAWLRTEDVGCLVVRARSVPWWARVGITRARWPDLVLALGVPVMIARAGSAPGRVVVAVGPEHDAGVIAGVGIDLARQTGLPLVLLTVLPPSVSQESVGADDATREAARLARLHGVEPTCVVDRGNPIERIRAHCQATDLLVVGHAAARRNSLFTPDVSLFLMHSTPCSALFVPWLRPAPN